MYVLARSNPSNPSAKGESMTHTVNICVCLIILDDVNLHNKVSNLPESVPDLQSADRRAKKLS